MKPAVRGAWARTGLGGWQSLQRREGITPNSYLLGGLWLGGAAGRGVSGGEFWGAGCRVAMGWLPAYKWHMGCISGTERRPPRAPHSPTKGELEPGGEPVFQPPGAQGSHSGRESNCPLGPWFFPGRVYPRVKPPGGAGHLEPISLLQKTGLPMPKAAITVPYGLNYVPHKVICWGPNPQHLGM